MSDYNEYGQGAPLAIEQMLDGDTPGAIYQRGYAAGVAAERARVVAALDKIVADVTTGKEDDLFSALVELANSLAARQ